VFALASDRVGGSWMRGVILLVALVVNVYAQRLRKTSR
jgi:hypothetical protein